MTTTTVDRAPAAARRPGPARARLTPLAEARATTMTASGPSHALAPLAIPAESRVALPGRRGAYGAVASAPQDPTVACCALVQAAVEALRGARPIAQLVRWVTPQVYESVAQRAALTTRVRGEAPAGFRTSIRRVRLCRLGDTAVEAAVIVDDGPRVRAVAVRLEMHRNSWRAVALEIG